ncbi:MAG: CpsD/CapB family tyrosine-protein kinase [Caulobacterales bacterium]|nr:CpsD/CapB family tyrosine-protein kinase [Caulobacterales bacterium]
MSDPTPPGQPTANPVDSLRYRFSPQLVTLAEGHPAEAEAVRTLRTHIIARHIDDGRRGLAVCSAKPGVGCSFTAVNLAVALSQVGVATLIIDADLRKPSLESFIQPEAPKPRSVDADRTPLERIHQEVLPDLSVLYAGDLARSSEELLGGDNFRRLMERCLRDFEFTIIDTPPASDSSDGLRVASVIGYALVVARTNVTLMKDVSQLAKQLQEDGANLIGAVLNET